MQTAMGERLTELWCFNCDDLIGWRVMGEPIPPIFCDECAKKTETANG